MLAAHEAIIDAERPISLTVWTPAAISIPRKSAQRRLDVFKRPPRLRRDGCGSVRVPHPVSWRLAPQSPQPTERSRSGRIRAPDPNTRTRAMFAVIRTGGKQYRVAAEDVIKVEKVKGDPGEIVQFGEVLVVGGDSVTLGSTDHCRRLGRRRGPRAGTRAEDHRLQEASPQEFAQKARPPAGIHAHARDRNPHRRGKANRHRTAQARAEEAGGRRRRAEDGRTPPRAEAPKRQGTRQDRAKAEGPQRNRPKPPAKKAGKPKSGGKGKKK